MTNKYKIGDLIIFREWLSNHEDSNRFGMITSVSRGKITSYKVFLFDTRENAFYNICRWVDKDFEKVFES